MSPIRSINRHVSLLFRMGERFLNREMAGSGISSGTAPLLLELRDAGNSTPVTIAAAVGVDKAYVTRAIQSLKQAGYVAVVSTKTDGRSVTVSLTEEGRVAADRVEAVMRAWIGIASRVVSQTDLDTVNAVFDLFYTNAQEYLNRGNKFKY